MGRLLEHKMSFGDFSGTLWKLIKEDTLVWGEPSEEEKLRKRNLRRKVFEDSAVPWILNDLAGVLGFYDDVQDIVSFARWNKKIISPRRFAKCMRGEALSGRTGVAAMARCMCPMSRGTRKRTMKAMGPFDLFLLGPLVAFALRIFPATAPIMWALLAGQVGASLLGYGIKLGPIMGASMEIFYRGLGALGLPFDRSHNKWYQLKIARTLQKADKGFGASHLVDWEDRLTAIAGTRMALRDGAALPEFIVRPQDYPSFDDLWSDPLGTAGNLFRLVGSLVPNLAAYMANDFLLPMFRDIARIATGREEDAPVEMSDFLRAALAVAHKYDCPGGGACDQAMEDAVALEEYARSVGIDVEHETRWERLESLFTNFTYARAGGSLPGYGESPRLFPGEPY